MGAVGGTRNEAEKRDRRAGVVDGDESEVEAEDEDEADSDEGEDSLEFPLAHAALSADAGWEA
jgi:hypothetical protein